MKRMSLLLAGVGSLLLSGWFGLLLIQFLTGGAGMQLFGPLVFPAAAALGLVQVLALATLCYLFLLLGIGCCALAFVGPQPGKDR